MAPFRAEPESSVNNPANPSDDTPRAHKYSARLGGPEIRLDRAAELDGHGIAVAVLGGRVRHPDPSFAHAILLDIGLLDALESYADAALEQCGVVERAAGVVGEAVRRMVVHGNGS